MVSQYCAVADCWELYGGTSSKHRFPNPNKNKYLFDKWVAICANKKLQDYTPERIYNNCRVCSKHFMFSDFGRNNVLNKGVWPTIDVPITDISGTEIVSMTTFQPESSLCEPTSITSLQSDATTPVETIPSLSFAGVDTMQSSSFELGLDNRFEIVEESSLDSAPRNIFESILELEHIAEDHLQQFLEVKNETGSANEQFSDVKYDTDSANDIKRCRTCAEAGDDVCSILSNIKNFVSTFRDMIVLLVPQMDNVLHEDDVICENCCEIIISCAKFIEKCLRVGLNHTDQKAIDDFDSNKSKIEGTSSAVSPDQFSDDIKSQNQDGDPDNKLDVHQYNNTLLVDDSAMENNEHQLYQVHNGDVPKMCYLKEWPKSIVEHNRVISVRNLTPQQQYEFTHILASNDVQTLQFTQFDQNMDRKRIIFVGTTLKCKRCSRYFSKKYLLNKHMNVHKFVDQRRAQCDRLAKLRIEKKKAERSMRHRSRNIENLVCKTCLERCSSKEELAAHLKLHPPLICEKCGKGFSSQIQLNVHAVCHNPINSYICEVCGMGYKSRTSLRTHMMLHENKTYLCSKCSKEFNTALKLRKHLKYTHGEGLSSVWPCKECNKVFKTPWNLNAHYRLMHLKVATHKCDTCGRGFSRADYLRRHKRRHIIYENAPKYPRVKGKGVPRASRAAQCQICNKVLKSVVNLKLHIRTHGKLSRFACKYCNMTFKIIYQRNRHERLHEKSDLRYRCGICWKRFENQEELDQHSLKHNNLKYKCEMCDQSFARKHLLDDHFVKSHVDDDDVVDESRAIYTAALGIPNDDDMSES